MKDPIAHWREAGEWWGGEPGREVLQFYDEHGIRREETHLLPGIRSPGGQSTEEETHSEEIALKIRKRRDEKVAQACGYLPASVEVIRRETSQPYAMLHAMSGYSFGESTMLAEEIPLLCARLGVPAAALVDRFSLAGAIEFTRKAHEAGIKPILGATLTMETGGEIVVLCENARGYRELCQLLTACHREEPRQHPLCTWERLGRYREGLLCLTGGERGPLNLAIKRQQDPSDALENLLRIFGTERLWVEVERSFLPWEIRVNKGLQDLARAHGLRCVAGGAAHYARRDDFPVQDVLHCAQTLCRIEEILGRKPLLGDEPTRGINAEKRLKSPAEFYALFADQPGLIEETRRIAERCDPHVLPARSEPPAFAENSNQKLYDLALHGAKVRYKGQYPRNVRRVERELERITRLGYADHFLVIWDACKWARKEKILFSARGSVVDSAVAFCLGLSRIDAVEHGLHFDRFLPEDGSKRPDIDIDFEARYRDRIREYFAQKYGYERVSGLAAISAYNIRGIVREVGKVFGLPQETIGFLAKRIHGGVDPANLESALGKRPELRDSSFPRERLQWIIELAARMADIPRHTGAHSSGVIVSSQPIHHLCPVMNSASPFVSSRIEDSPDDDQPLFPIIQWDKRSAKYVFDKFDILCLRGQDVLGGTESLVIQSEPGFKVEELPLDDPETYRAMRAGQLIGIPQSASPAMRQAHVRLKTENLSDASLVQAGIRPGVGGAVKINELIARRRGKPYTLEHPELDRILGHTYGIVVFQEQIDQLLQTFAGYISGKAEDTRDQIHKRRREGYAEQIKLQVKGDILKQGFAEEVAEAVYQLVAGFSGYGFAEGHALSFAEISIRSIYCQQNYPAEYFAALLSAQPAGYYGSTTIANEARARGLRILPPDVHESEERFTVEDAVSEEDPKLVFPRGGVRVGLRQVGQVSAATRQRILSLKPFEDYFDFVARVRPNQTELTALILSGALDRFHPSRRDLLWSIPSANQFAQALLAGNGLALEFEKPMIERVNEDFNPVERALTERAMLEMDVAQHLMAFERTRVSAKGGLSAVEVNALPARRRVFTVGNPIRLRFPPTPSGKRVVFFDLEDETGLLNVTCFDAVYQRYGHAIVCSPFVTLVGQTQDRDGHTAFLAERVYAYRPRTLEGIRDDILDQRTQDFLVGGRR